MADDPTTPFDHPRKLWERLLFPLAREIWLEGYRGGASDG